MAYLHARAARNDAPLFVRSPHFSPLRPFPREPHVTTPHASHYSAGSSALRPVGARARRPIDPPVAPAASSAPPCTLSPSRPTIYLLHLHARDELVETAAIAVVLDLDEIVTFGTFLAPAVCRGRRQPR